MERKHKHHIIPKHMGGSNDPSNLIELTVEQHAQAHLELYEKYGKWQDLIAFKMLSGQITTNEEGRLEAIREMHKERKRTGQAKIIGQRAARTKKEKGLCKHSWNAGLYLKDNPDNDALKKLSISSKNLMKAGKIHCIGDSMRGKKFSKSHKEKLRAKALSRDLIECEHCNSKHIKQMYVRWHGEKCKMNPNLKSVTDLKEGNGRGRR